VLKKRTCGTLLRSLLHLQEGRIGMRTCPTDLMALPFWPGLGEQVEVG